MNLQLKDYLDRMVDTFNQPSFIPHDPVSIPHRFSNKQDIEIAGFFASIFAWGNRTTIINKATSLLQLMDHAPHQFVTQHQEADLKKFMAFKHRTFNTTDLLYFIAFLQFHYRNHSSLETAFIKGMHKEDEHTENALRHFHEYFFSLPFAPERTRKHIATPARASHCKRLNMFLRWMVRNDNKGVDFGIWDSIRPSQLVCPVDVHVARIARQYNLLSQKVLNWAAAVELTHQLKTFDPMDPVKYDFALFGIGVSEKLRIKN